MAEFDARTGEPGQEITYTTTERRPIDDIEDAPPGATVTFDDPDPDKPEAPRKAYAIVEGVQRTLRAGENGLFHPKSSADEQVLDSFGLKVHKAHKEKKAAAEAPAGNGS